MQKLLAGIALALMTQSASAEIFAVKAEHAGDTRIVTELDTQRGNCGKDHQYARVTLRDVDLSAMTIVGEGCWFLMPGSQVAVMMTDNATRKESITHYATTDFFTQKEPGFWWQFTPGLQEERTPTEAKKVVIPAGGPVAEIRVPFQGGAFDLVYQLSRRSAPVERCNGYEGGRSVLISVVSPQTYPRALPYADGCWYTNRAQEVIIIARAMQSPIDFVHSYPAEDFYQAEDFWQVAIGAE